MDVCSLGLCVCVVNYDEQTFQRHARRRMVYDVATDSHSLQRGRVSTTAPMIDQHAGPRLRAWLEAQDPPRPAEIARRAGVSRQFVSNVLAGRAKPTQAIVEACEELGLPVGAIFGLDSRRMEDS